VLGGAVAGAGLVSLLLSILLRPPEKRVREREGVESWSSSLCVVGLGADMEKASALVGVVEWRGGRESSSNLSKILKSVAMQRSIYKGQTWYCS
jgi:hypothetical protein